MFTPKPTKVNKKFISIPQPRFPKGYISILTDSRIPNDALARMYNMTLEQDSIPRPRPPFKPYGAAFVGECIGIGTFVKWVGGQPDHYEISMQVTPTNEVQTLTITGSPTGGTFTLTFGGQTTTAIAYNAIASAVQSALQALSSVGAGNVVCSAGPLPGTAVTITFQGTLANADQATITATSSLTGGSTPAINISETIKGGNRGALYTRKDGGAWNLIAGSYRYSATAWTSFTQGGQLTSSDTLDSRVYISNGTDNMSYYDVTADTVTSYAGLTTPTISSVTASSGLSGTNYNQYYRVSANNAGGESAAAASMSAAISTARDYWDSSTQSIAVSWGAVAGATSYNIYTSDQSGQEAYLATVNGTTFTDNGVTAINIYKLAPNNDSSAGPLITTMINIDNQLFGVGDPNNPQYLWYSGLGQHFGDFSFNPQGGGYVGIDYGGDTSPTAPFPFHDGKGNPAPSILTHGSAGRGKLYHVQFTSTTVGSTSLTYPNVYEASAQDGTPAPRGVALYNQNAYYCTGTAVKTTGTKPNIINILATDTISDQILPDIQDLNLQALPNYVNEEFLGKIYFAFPVAGSSTNNQIWVLDLTRGGLWVLYWELADGSSIQHMWLYQDNSGASHMFILTSDNTVLELDLLRTSVPTQDNGTAFSTTCRSGAMVFDAGGVAEVASYFMYHKFLYPVGLINISISGVNEDGGSGTIAASSFNQEATTAPFIWGQLLYSNPDGSSVFSGDSGSFSGSNPGKITATNPASVTLDTEVDEILSEQTWEVTTQGIGCDYLLSSVTTTAYTIPRRYAGSS